MINLGFDTVFIFVPASKERSNRAGTSDPAKATAPHPVPSPETRCGAGRGPAIYREHVRTDRAIDLAIGPGPLRRAPSIRRDTRPPKRRIRRPKASGQASDFERGKPTGGDYGASRLVLAIVGLLVIGGRRLSHLAHVSLDPVLLRFCGLARMPSDRTLVRWLEAFTPPALERLADVIRDGVYRAIEREGLARLTIDLDGTVLRTGAKVDGAMRGFNPHHPKDPSYYPLTAHIAQLGQILRIWNRPGNVTDSHHADGFLRVILRELRARFGRAMAIELRMDGAFFMPHVFALLDEAGVDYAIKVPFWRWLGLQPKVAAQTRWTRVDADIDGFERVLAIPQWERSERVVVYRKRVAHEKTLAELKHHVAFAAIPTNDRMANSAWQMLSALTLNLVRSFQIAAGAAPRRRTWKRTFDYVFPSLQTLRFELIHQPARLARL